MAMESFEQGRSCVRRAESFWHSALGRALICGIVLTVLQSLYLVIFRTYYKYAYSGTMEGMARANIISLVAGEMMFFVFGGLFGYLLTRRGDRARPAAAVAGGLLCGLIYWPLMLADDALTRFWSSRMDFAGAHAVNLGVYYVQLGLWLGLLAAVFARRFGPFGKRLLRGFLGGLLGGLLTAGGLTAVSLLAGLIHSGFWPFDLLALLLETIGLLTAYTLPPLLVLMWVERKKGVPTNAVV